MRRHGIQRPQFKGSAPSPGSPAFAPTDIANLAVWYDAADASTVTLDGSDNVEQWDDKSGNARHATQSTVLNRPNYSLASLNGLNTLSFDGAGDEMTTYAMPSNPWTSYIVHKWSAVNADSRLISNRSVDGLSVGIASASSWNLSFVRESVAWVPSGWAQGTSARLYRVVFTTGAASFFSCETGTATLRQTTALTGTIGAHFGMSLPGNLCEVINYSRELTAGEHTSLETYLIDKWGL